MGAQSKGGSSDEETAVESSSLRSDVDDDGGGGDDGDRGVCGEDTPHYSFLTMKMMRRRMKGVGRQSPVDDELLGEVRWGGNIL